MTYDDLVKAAGEYNDGHITTIEFYRFLQEWANAVSSSELELLAGAITWAWAQMNEETAR